MITIDKTKDKEISLNFNYFIYWFYDLHCIASSNLIYPLTWGCPKTVAETCRQLEIKSVNKVVFDIFCLVSSYLTEMEVYLHNKYQSLNLVQKYSLSYSESCTRCICALYGQNAWLLDVASCGICNHLLLLPLALQPAVGFGLSNNTSPFFPIYH